MVPRPGSFWTKRRYVRAVVRVRPDQSLQPTLGHKEGTTRCLGT
jgi:hypothetical protein